MVNQAEDDVPHDRTPLFDLRVLIAGMRFRVSSRAVKNGFIALPNCFVVCGRTKQLHGIATTAVARMALRAGKPGTRCWTDGAKHNAAKRNMIARRRRLSMLDAQIHSKAMSTQVVPRFDAKQVNLGNITFREVSHQPLGWQFTRRSTHPSDGPIPVARQNPFSFSPGFF